MVDETRRLMAAFDSRLTKMEDRIHSRLDLIQDQINATTEAVLRHQSHNGSIKAVGGVAAVVSAIVAGIAAGIRSVVR